MCDCFVAGRRGAPGFGTVLVLFLFFGDLVASEQTCTLCCCNAYCYSSCYCCCRVLYCLQVKLDQFEVLDVDGGPILSMSTKERGGKARAREGGRQRGKLGVAFTHFDTLSSS